MVAGIKKRKAGLAGANKMRPNIFLTRMTFCKTMAGEAQV